MRTEHDPLAAYIFTARRQYRNTHDTKGGKAKDRCAMLTWQRACDLGSRRHLGRVGTTNGCNGETLKEPYWLNERPLPSDCAAQEQPYEKLIHE